MANGPNIFQMFLVRYACPVWCDEWQNETFEQSADGLYETVCVCALAVLSNKHGHRANATSATLFGTVVE